MKVRVTDWLRDSVRPLRLTRVSMPSFESWKKQSARRRYRQCLKTIMTNRRRKNSKQSRALELILPATSANLGPAFDAAALAFRLFLKIRAQTASQFSIVA